MTRQNAVNFSGALQFPYANAPTDLFKKEDVQILAQATDGHDHSSGKGLMIPGTAIQPETISHIQIQNGSIWTEDLADNIITSAKLADGAVTRYAQIANNVILTQHIADGQVTSAKIQDGGVGSVDIASQACHYQNYVGLTAPQSTTSSTFVQIPTSQISAYVLPSLGVGPQATWVNWTLSLTFSATASASIAWNMDGGGFNSAWYYTGAAGTTITASGWMITSGAVGSHTYAMGWAISAGTLSLSGVTYNTFGVWTPIR